MRLVRARRIPVLLGMCVGLAAAGWPAAALAVPVTSPLLPPTEGQYVSLTDWHAYYESYGVALLDPIHKGFTGILREPGPGYEQETFDSVLTAETALGPITLTGLVTTRVYGYTSGALGTFDTEIVSMLLSGYAGGYYIEVREDVNKDSLGETTITDEGGGMYDIESFFDVYTELRLNDGPWDPGVYPTGEPRMVFAVPEPSAAVLAIIGLMLVKRWR